MQRKVDWTRHQRRNFLVRTRSDKIKRIVRVATTHCKDLRWEFAVDLRKRWKPLL